MFTSTPINKELPQTLNQSLQQYNKGYKSNENLTESKKMGPGSVSSSQFKQRVSNKSFAEFKHSSARKLPLKDILSEIDEGDQWAEITKFQMERDQEQKKKEEMNILKKKMEIKAVLDAQLRERQKEVEKRINEEKNFEVNLLQKLKKEELEERKKAIERKQKILEEKNKRDIMLKEFHEKKKVDYHKEMVSESEYLEKLKSEVEREKA